MHEFDVVLISVFVACMICAIQLFYDFFKNDSDKGKIRVLRSALLILILIIACLPRIAFRYSFPSAILGIPEETAPPPTETNPLEPSASQPTVEFAKPSRSPFDQEMEPGDILTYGAYEQDGFSSDGREPIEWVVLDKTDGKALLLSNQAMDCVPYNNQNVGCTWATCSLRKWLNDTFYKKAFSTEEREWILKSRVAAHKNPDSSTNPGMDTDDYIFLLSVDEVKYYLPNNSDRMCSPTEYAVTQGAFREYRLGTCWWWLRTPGETSQDASSVNSDGTIDTDDGSVNSGKGCVRPAMWVRIGD